MPTKTVTALLLTVITLGACSTANVGREPNAIRGKQLGDAIVTALEKYRQEHGAYPDDIATVAPYFARNTWAEIQSMQATDTVFFIYNVDRGQFELSFRYAGNSRAKCYYQPKEPTVRRWDCVEKF